MHNASGKTNCAFGPLSDETSDLLICFKEYGARRPRCDSRVEKRSAETRATATCWTCRKQQGDADEVLNMIEIDQNRGPSLNP